MSGRDDLFVEDIPDDLSRQLDLDNRTKKDAVIAALRREYGTTDGARLEMRLEHRREQRRFKVKERDAIQRDIDELDEEIAALESQLEDVRATAEDYESELDAILDEMVATGMHVDPGHGAVETLAEVHDSLASDVIADLEKRAEERGLDLPDQRFEPKDGGRR